MQSRFKTASLGLILGATLITAGCSLNDKVQEQVEEQEKIKEQEKIELQNVEKFTEEQIDQQIEDNRFDERKQNHEDNYVMSEHQKKLLEEAESQTAEEAMQHNSLDKRVLISKDVPQPKEKYTDKVEAAQYLSYVLFQYHSSQIDGKAFYKKIEPYMHPEFEEMLPSTTERREMMFESVQQLFTNQLKGPITDYEVTEVSYNEREKEGHFYRKYTVKEGEPIYYKTRLALGENGEWLMLDDEPTAGYEIENTHVSTEFKQQFIETEGE